MLYNIYTSKLEEVIPIRLGRPPKNVEEIKLFSDQFNRIIAEKNLTQATIADGLGMRQQTISLWVNGKRMPSKKNMMRLKTLLNVDEL